MFLTQCSSMRAINPLHEAFQGFGPHIRPVGRSVEVVVAQASPFPRSAGLHLPTSHLLVLAVGQFSRAR